MKKVLIAASALVLLVAIAAFSFKSETNPILDLGAKAPETKLEMADVSGENITLESVAQKNGLLVIFSCNTCPFVIGNGTKTEGWEGRYPGIAEMAMKNDIGMVLVNSNEAKRSAGDSMEDMKKRYAEKNLKGYYVLDENHKLADAFGALTTPHVYLFDGDMKLIYKGAIDDSVDSSKDVKQAYLENAIKAHVNGKKIDPASTKQLGCSIKRVKA
jgi:hypothetical protein